MDKQYVVIEGNIGAGKTTLVKKLAADFNAKTLLESFAENPFLPEFYKNPQRHAFPLELFFLAERYQQMNEDFARPDLFQKTILADYHFFKSLLFADVTLKDEELRLFKRLYNIIYKTLPKPELILYLHVSVERLLMQIEKRGRTYEKTISATYLQSIQAQYFDFFKSLEKTAVVVLDVGDKEFVSENQNYLTIRELLTKSWSAGMHYVEL